MSSLKENKTCAILEQYLSYLTVIKGCSILTADEYRIDNLMLFSFVKEKRSFLADEIKQRDFSDVDIDFIIYCGEVRKVTTATLSRKIVSIWHFFRDSKHVLRLYTVNTFLIY